MARTPHRDPNESAISLASPRRRFLHTAVNGTALFAGALLTACGPRPLPERESPVLTPSGGTAFLHDQTAVDSRRSGVVAILDDSTRTPTVIRATADGTTVLFDSSAAPGADHNYIERLVSRADDDAAYLEQGSTSAGDILYRVEGTTITDLTPRVRALYPLSPDRPPEQIVALDLAADGSVLFGIADRVCALGTDGTDLCQDYWDLAVDDYLWPVEIVSGSGGVYLLGDGDDDSKGDHLYRSTAVGGTWTVVSDRNASQLFALDGERVGYVDETGVHILAADGSEERTIAATIEGTIYGHDPASLWEVLMDIEAEPDGCGLLGCDELVHWQQEVVWRITDERREIGHVDVTENLFGDHVGITPLEDGSLWIETVVGDVYHVTP